MAAPQGVVRVHRQGLCVTFRMEGRGTMTQSMPLRRYAERCLAEGTTEVRVDLRHCTHMDSTFMGTLLTLQGLLSRRVQGRLTVVSPSPGCAQVFQQMGLDGIFHTETIDEPDLAWQELPAETPDMQTFKRTVTEAHEELANLPGPAGEQFRTVVRCMSDAERGSKPPPPPPSGSRKRDE
jgi:anti-anti-sigma factor